MKTFVALKNGRSKEEFLPKENFDLLASYGEYSQCGDAYDRDFILKNVADADIYLTAWGSPRLDADILDAAPNLKLLVHVCGTVAPYVSDEMWKRGVRVISGNAGLAETTAEGAVAYIFAAQREIPKYSDALHDRKIWKKSTDVSRSLLGKTVGIVSYGAVAKNVLRMIQPFRVKILVYDIVEIPEEEKRKYNMEQVSLEELFSRSDIISVHTPLNSATHNLIGKPLFDLIQPDALFLNTSRGEVIDQAALEDALETERFRAALDVYSPEPPLETSKLFDLPNVLMMPHMAGPTTDIRKELARKMIVEAHEFIDLGKPLRNEITAAVAARMSEH